MKKKNKAEFLLSSDTLSWYWLDLVFQVGRDLNFDWLDLAIRKNFDARNCNYVKRLVKNYDLPVKVIQVSNRVNRKEINYATDLAKEVKAETIAINSPFVYDFRTFKFISKDLPAYRKHNPWIKFCVVNPPKSSLFALPVPKYHFTNIVEIIKKHKFYLGLDVANIDESVLENTFLRKIWNFIPYIGVIYVSDKTKTWVWHVSMWDWVLKLPSIFRKFKQNEYFGHFSLKVDISKKDLLDLEKIEQILKKNKIYFKENFENLVIS